MVEVKGVPVSFVDDFPRRHHVPLHRTTDNHFQAFKHQRQFASPFHKLNQLPQWQQQQESSHHEDHVNWEQRQRRREERSTNSQPEKDSWRFGPEANNQNFEDFSEPHNHQSLHDFRHARPLSHRQQRSRRDVPIKFNDWEFHRNYESAGAEPIAKFNQNKKYDDDYSPRNGVDYNDNGYCNSVDCRRERLTINHIRRMSPNAAFMSTPAGQTPKSNNGGGKSNTRNSLPLQMARSSEARGSESQDQPPRNDYADQEQQQQEWEWEKYRYNEENFHEFFQPDHQTTQGYKPFPSRPANTMGNLKESLRDLDQFGHAMFASGMGAGEDSFPDLSVVRFRSSSIALGDNLEIVRIELDISDGEENEETKLEDVDDQ
ncbi:hypothetical protein Fcan01_05737 [Folsomia candida]|uniref:Uncharacterized protein n=2 Tax=Folsomia candida TaxID=158441 RepID=A0A226ERE7_FOLCA|nr:hypothetical protein Fcan01_05737 [Folsomia candida]